MTQFPIPTTPLTEKAVLNAITNSPTGSTAVTSDSVPLVVKALEKDKIPAALDLLSIGSEHTVDVQEALGRRLYEIGLFTDKNDHDLVCVATFYFAYSTLDGRVLFVDQIGIRKDNDNERYTLMTTTLRVLADVAVHLECQRLAWLHYKEDLDFLTKTLKAETLQGLLTLLMSKDAMTAFVGDLIDTHIHTSPSSNTLAVPEAIQVALPIMNKPLAAQNLELIHANNETYVDTIEELAMGLAIYEKMPDDVHIGKEHYRTDGYKTTDGMHPGFQCFLLKDLANDTFCGMACIYFGYNVGKGRFLYLEALYIDKSCRGRGGGKSIMKTLAVVAKLTGCTGFKWQAFDWNAPALGFYGSIGAEVQDGLLTTRFAGEKLIEFQKGKLE